jgi:hypothetical protein
MATKKRVSKLLTITEVVKLNMTFEQAVKKALNTPLSKNKKKAKK